MVSAYSRCSTGSALGKSSVRTDSSEATRESAGAFWQDMGRMPSKSSKRSESMLVMRVGARASVAVRTAPRRSAELQLRATGRCDFDGIGEAPTCPGGGSSDTKLTISSGSSTETSAEREALMRTRKWYVTSTWRPRRSVRASGCGILVSESAYFAQTEPPSPGSPK